MVRQILIWPDPALTRACWVVPQDQLDALREPKKTALNGNLRSLMDDMCRTMLLAKGSGLSAPQVGVFSRVMCVKVKHTGVARGEEAVCLINPEYTFLAEEKVATVEGCLSLPGVAVPVQRAKYVRVRAIGYDGAPFEIGGDGLLAVALQHELDHLDGKLVTDHLSWFRRDMLKRKLTKLKHRGLHYNLPAEKRT